MKTAAFMTTTATALMMAFQASAQTTFIDDAEYAAAVSDYITDHCPAKNAEASPEATKSCIAETINVTNKVATDMKDYILDVIAPFAPFAAGVSNGDLTQYCIGRLDSVGGRVMPLANYTAAAFSAVKECAESMERAGQNVGIDFQPTARNAIFAHMNNFQP